MELITERSAIKTTIDFWIDNCVNFNPGNESHAMVAQLKGLAPETVSAQVVAGILDIKIPDWAAVFCDECGCKVDAVVEIQCEAACADAPLQLCSGCLQKDLNLIKGAQ